MGRLKHQQSNTLWFWLQFIKVHSVLRSQAAFTSTETACSWDGNGNKSLLDEITHKNTPRGLRSSFPHLSAWRCRALPSSLQVGRGICASSGFSSLSGQMSWEENKSPFVWRSCVSPAVRVDFSDLKVRLRSSLWNCQWCWWRSVTPSVFERILY